MEHNKVLTTLRSTYCGVCFDSFENFSLPLQDFAGQYSVKDFGSFLSNPSCHDSSPALLALKKLLNCLISSQIQEKKVVFCRDCNQTIHWACLPNKSYKNPKDVVFLKGVAPITTFLCCICQMKSHSSVGPKDKKPKVSGACMECTQSDGLRLALQGKKREVLLSQFVHPVCAFFSSVIAPKHLEEMSFFRYVSPSSNFQTSREIQFGLFRCAKDLFLLPQKAQIFFCELWTFEMQPPGSYLLFSQRKNKVCRQ